MSSLLVGRAFYVDLPAHLKFTLIALADEANDDGGSIFIGQKRLAIKVGHSERSVRTNLADLRDRGFIRRLVERHPNFGTDQYEIDVHKLPGQSPTAATTSAPTGSPLPRKKALGSRSSSVASASSQPTSTSRRDRDLLFDAVAAAWLGVGALKARIPRRASGRIAEACKELREIGATPEQVGQFAAWWREAKSGYDLTPQAITGNWPTFLAGPTAPRKAGNQRPDPPRPYDPALAEIEIERALGRG